MVTDLPKPSAQAACVGGRIEIVFADAVVRMDGAADSATVRAVLQGLRP